MIQCSSCISSTVFLRIPSPKSASYCEALYTVGYANIQIGSWSLKKYNGQIENILFSLSFEIQIWDENFWNALCTLVRRMPQQRFDRTPPPIQVPTEALHPNPPAQQHQLSDEAKHLGHCDDPIKLFDSIFCPYEFRTILNETLKYRKHNI